MRYVIITDTHFGHPKIIEYGRPADYELQLIDNLNKILRDSDVLIHLGDVCMSNMVENHQKILDLNCARKWLIRGNHDKQSDTWYIGHGWDVVVSSLTIQRYGLNITFSHKPVTGDFDLNIHGHLHGREMEPELVGIQGAKHYLFTVEHHYKPKLLESIIKEIR